MRQFISWRRVSTRKQGHSRLGLEAQQEIISHFVKMEKGELITDYCEVYTGTELSGCTELRKAISRCKQIGATLIIAKSDRFRNTIEALQIFEEMGDGNIYFCDLPHSDKFTLTLFFALAEREAMITSIRTKAALDAKKARGEATGGTKELWGKNTGSERMDSVLKAGVASGKARLERAKANPENRAFFEFMMDWEDLHGKVDWKKDGDLISSKLNSRGRRTATGMEYTPKRAKAMYNKVMKMYGKGANYNHLDH